MGGCIAFRSVLSAAVRPTGRESCSPKEARHERQHDRNRHNQHVRLFHDGFLARGGQGGDGRVRRALAASNGSDELNEPRPPPDGGSLLEKKTDHLTLHLKGSLLKRPALKGFEPDCSWK